MTLTCTINGTTAVPSENLSITGEGAGGITGLTSAAITGGSDIAGITFDDPDETLELLGYHAIWFDEDDCTPSRIWTGLIEGKRVSRGQYRGVGRVWDCDLIGLNAGPSLRVIRPTDDPKRPAETNLERIDWLLGTSAVIGASTVFSDDGFVNDSHPRPFDETDYLGQYPADVLNDISGVINRNWYVFYNPATDGPTLFYDNHDVGLGDCDYRISNVIADQDGSTFYPLVDGALDRDPSEVYTGVVLTGRFGSIFRENIPAEIEFIDHELTISNERIGKLSTAEAFAADFLAGHDSERDSITCVIHVPSNEVNLIREGMRIECKFSHLPGYESFTWLIVRRRTVSQRADYSYIVALELSVSSVAGNSGGGGDPGDLPNPPCRPEHYYSGSIYDAQPTGGPDLPPTAAATSAIYANDTVYNLSVTITEETITGTTSFVGFTVVDDDVPSILFSSTIGPAVGTYTGTFSVGASSGTMTAYLQVIHNDVHPSDATVDFWIDPDGWVTPECLPPAPGQWVYGEVVTMSGADGTTAFPFAAGSLTVYVDLTDQTAKLVSQDGATGDFTLGFTPTPTEVVTVDYQGR